MPTTPQSPADRGHLRLVAADAPGAVWDSVGDEMV